MSWVAATPFVPTLALGFDRPWLLPALLVIFVPWLIHRFSNPVARQQQWAAIEILERAIARRAYRSRIQRLLLLLLRAVMLAVIVLAAARPRAASSLAPETSAAPCRLIVIDCSGSMQRTSNGRSMFDSALMTARRIVAASRPADALGLLRLADSAGEALVVSPTRKHAEIISAVGTVRVTASHADVLQTLKALQRILDGQPAGTVHEVILISDFQTVEWRPTHSERRAAIEESIQRLANAARVVCVPVRLTAGFNLAIESIEIEPQFVCAGDLVTVTATVRNHDRDSARGEFLEFLLDNRRVDSTALSIPPGHSKRFAFRLTPTEPGPHSISIHLSDDALPVDNVRWRALNVHEHIDALVVGDRLARASDVGASGFVRLSLAPETSGNPQTKRLAVTSADIQDLGSLDLQPFECVFVCGVEAFADREIAVLESWVRSGGTIVFAPTGATNSRAWNEKLGAARRGLLPVQLGGRVGSATRPDAVFRFDTRNLEHSLFRVYANDQARRGLHNVLTFEYFRLLPEQDRNVEIPLRFENQDPAIAMGRYGDGTCVVLATAADEKRWSTWHLAGGHFLVIVNELAHHAAEHREPSAERIVGERIEYRESSGGKAEHAVLRDPHGRIVPLFLESSNEHDIVRSAGLTAPGIYRFRSGRDEPEQLFAVNPDTKQSDPASPDRVALETVFGPGVEVVRSQPESALNSVRKPIDPGHEPKLVVLLATIALVLLMIEQWTAFTKHSNLHAAPTETSSQTSRESM